MRSSLFRRLGLLPALLALLVAACGSTTPVGPDPTPVPEPPVIVTDTFEGTVGTGGDKVHTFLVDPGVVTTTLTAVEPDVAPVLGLDVGLWDPATEGCLTVLYSLEAAPGTVLVGTARQKYTLCVRVYDIGNFEEGASVNYQVKVEHPKPKEE